ncbi:hypothetical protein pb186bvf_008329 [Paramecium bursaria]
MNKRILSKKKHLIIHNLSNKDQVQVKYFKNMLKEQYEGQIKQEYNEREIKQQLIEQQENSKPISNKNNNLYEYKILQYLFIQDETTKFYKLFMIQKLQNDEMKQKINEQAQKIKQFEDRLDISSKHIKNLEGNKQRDQYQQKDKDKTIEELNKLVQYQEQQLKEQQKGN